MIDFQDGDPEDGESEVKMMALQDLIRRARPASDLVVVCIWSRGHQEINLGKLLVNSGCSLSSGATPLQCAVIWLHVSRSVGGMHPHQDRVVMRSYGWIPVARSPELEEYIVRRGYYGLAKEFYKVHRTFNVCLNATIRAGVTEGGYVMSVATSAPDGNSNPLALGIAIFGRSLGNHLRLNSLVDCSFDQNGKTFTLVGTRPGGDADCRFLEDLKGMKLMDKCSGGWFHRPRVDLCDPLTLEEGMRLISGHQLRMHAGDDDCVDPDFGERSPQELENRVKEKIDELRASEAC
ncbi:hypothetical protein EDD85DRAFT_786451 [Armillaria nabsnona]|nr:hypothetical protein EDD85DRAFT_786451 [Armillaria nabsnona]